MKALFFIFLLVLAWSTNIVTAQSLAFAKLCLAKHGNFLKHPQDCSKFIRCSHNQAYVFQCPDNLLWHHEIKSCDYSQHVECTTTKTSVKRETTKSITASKFKREIKNNSNIEKDNQKIFATTSKMPQKKLSTVWKTLTALPTTTTLHFPELVFKTSTLSNKLLKLTKEHTTSLPCINANISSNVDLMKNDTKTTIDNNNNTTKELINLLTTDQPKKFTSNIKLATEKIKETTNLFVNSSPETIELPTDQLKFLEREKFTGYSTKYTSSIELTTDPIQLSDTTNLSVNLTENLEKLTAETIINSFTEKLAMTTPIELPTDREKLPETKKPFQDTSAIQLITDGELMDTTNLSLKLTTDILVNATQENIVNLTTNKMESTGPLEVTINTRNSAEESTTDTSATEVTADYIYLREATSLLVNLTENLENLTEKTFVHLSTSNIEPTSPNELPTETNNSAGATKTDSSAIELRTSPNLSANLTGNLENLTKETCLTTHKIESSRHSELTTETKSGDFTTDSSATESTTDHDELTETTNLYLKLSTEILVNSTAGTFIYFTTNKLVTPNTIELPGKTTTTCGSENLVNLNTNIFVNLPTNKMNKLEIVETTNSAYETTEHLANSNSTEHFVNLQTLRSELTTDQADTSRPAELPEASQGWNLIDLTTENSVNFATTKSIKTDDPLQFAGTVELPTDQVALIETTNMSINLKENVTNSLISEAELKTDRLELELPTNQPEITYSFPNKAAGSLVYLTTEYFELVTDQLESSSTEVKSKDLAELRKTTENLIDFTESITQQLKFANIVELPTAPAELAKTSYFYVDPTTNLVNLATETSISSTTATNELSTDQLEFISTAFSNFDQTYSTYLSQNLTTENFENVKTDKSADIENENLVIVATENFTTVRSLNLMKETTTDLLESESSVRSITEKTVNVTTENDWQNLTKNLAATTNQPEIDTTENLLSAVLKEMTNNNKTEEAFVRPTIKSEEHTNLVNTPAEVLTNFIATTTEKPTNFISITTDLTSMVIPNFVSKGTENSKNFISAITVETNIFNKTTEENYLQSILNSTVQKNINENKVLLAKEGIFTNLSAISADTESSLTGSMSAIKTNTNSVFNAINEQNVESQITDQPMETKFITKSPEEVFSEVSVTHKISEIIKNSTLIPKKSTDQSKKDTTIGSLESKTTIDPRLPFRSPICQGEHNRRQFKAAKCYQYYQCFAGWAFLLNCHDGWLFQADIEACTQDVNNECKL